MVTPDGHAFVAAGRAEPGESAAPARRRTWSATTAPGVCRRAAAILSRRQPEPYEPYGHLLTGAMLAAAENLAAPEGTTVARLSALALRARIVDLARLVVDEDTKHAATPAWVPEG